MTHNFGEKTQEYSPKAGREVPVVLTPKFQQAKKKAIEVIDSDKYGLSDADFWILMNATKSGEKMCYTGLILSHNGCLKINDRLTSKFVPSCVTVDKDGFNKSLVFSYCNDGQGIYEVGEANAQNCKNDYIYAMAYKRLFDRVVLKLSRLAYDGIYSDSESEEFKEPDEHKTAARYDDPMDAPFEAPSVVKKIEEKREESNKQDDSDGKDHTPAAEEALKMFSGKTDKYLARICSHYEIAAITDMQRWMIDDFIELEKEAKNKKAKKN